jgi:hypothetical protein
LPAAKKQGESLRVFARFAASNRPVWKRVFWHFLRDWNRLFARVDTFPVGKKPFAGTLCLRILTRRAFVHGHCSFGALSRFVVAKLLIMNELERLLYLTICDKFA